MQKAAFKNVYNLFLFTCHMGIVLQIHCPFFKLHYNRVILWWPKSEYIYMYVCT